MGMHRHMNRHLIGAVLVAGIALASGACNRDADKMATSTDVQTQSAQPAKTPVTLQGCVKAGDAADTYVLTTARTAGSGDTATYQLVGEKIEGLREQVGRRVEITGTIEAQREIASRTTARPEDEERPTGTSGTPTVQTRSEIEIKRLSVGSVKPLSESCEQ